MLFELFHRRMPPFLRNFRWRYLKLITLPALVFLAQPIAGIVGCVPPQPIFPDT